LENTLKLFPESGTPMPEYGEDIRRLSYQRFSILYRIEGMQIQILTFYRQNQP
jgi:plasmid stabilization system protein ParE